MDNRAILESENPSGSGRRSLNALDVSRSSQGTTTRRGRGLSRGLKAGAQWCGAVATATACISMGAVHDAPKAAVLTIAAVGALTLLCAYVAGRRRPIRSPVLVTSLVLVALPAVQVVPLPPALRRALDPVGTQIVLEAAARPNPFKAAPLSLDPPATLVEVGKSGALAALLIIAFTASASRRQSLILPKVVAAMGFVAAVIGLGHRAFGYSAIYGQWQAGTGFLVGPFINPNHTAELLELTAFVAVACAWSNTGSLERAAWYVVGGVCAASALLTFSRTAFVLVPVGLLLLLVAQQLARAGEPERREGRARALGLSITLLVTGVAAASLGAAQVFGELKDTSIAEESRWVLWRNALAVIRQHPLGIGRGAFARVFPIYDQIPRRLALRYDYLENLPLQLLVDYGVVGFALVVGAVLIVGRFLLARRPFRSSELAMLVGLLVVLAHNCVDFGLETLGISLPFTVVLGTVLGVVSARVSSGKHVRKTAPTRAALATTMAATLVGIVALRTGYAANADASLSSPESSPGERRTMALLLSERHPTDYFYPLAQAAVEPTRTADAGSPRLKALARSLRLCPNCASVHHEIAHTMWFLGRKAQALSELRTVIRLVPGEIHRAVVDLERWGASPREIANLSGVARKHDQQIFDLLIARGALDAAREQLALMEGPSTPELDLCFARADLALQEGRLADAERELTRAAELDVHDSRGFGRRAALLLRRGDVSAALDELSRGIRSAPYDVALNRQNVSYVLERKRWDLAPAALEALKRALKHHGWSLAEVHRAAAAAARAKGRLAEAIAEVRMVVSGAPGDVAGWLELGSLYEESHRYSEALRAYQRALSLTGDPTARVAAARVEASLTRRFGPGDSLPDGQ